MKSYLVEMWYLWLEVWNLMDDFFLGLNIYIYIYINMLIYIYGRWVKGNNSDFICIFFFVIYYFQ